MQEMSQNEQMLIKELKSGSRKAFDAIYRMYARRLLGYSLQLTKTIEDAEEIVQDVFVQLWVNRESIRQEETLRSLLFIMAKHHLINAYRAQVNNLVFEEYVAHQEELVATDSAAGHMEYTEFLTQLKKALKSLPPTQQKVIELSRLHGLSNKDIATRLNLSEQTVRNQLSLGLKTLRSLLDKTLIGFWLLLYIN